MKNKRGILVENLLSLIIAVVGLVLIFYGAYKLYEVTVNQENEAAKNILNVIEARINNLDEGENGKFLIRGVKGWSLNGWSKFDSERPDDCFFGSCVCICPSDTSDQATACNERGYCRSIDIDNLILYGFFRDSEKEMISSPEEVVNDILNPKYYQRDYWVKGGAYYYILLNNPCPTFKEDILFELYVSKKEGLLGILLIEEGKQGETFTGLCNRRGYIPA